MPDRRQLSAAQSVSVQRSSGGLYRPARPHLRGRSEPRRAVAGADAAGARPGDARETAQPAILRRLAAGRQNGNRRSRETGGQMSTTHVPPPKKVNRIGLEVLPYKGSKTTLCAGCGHNAISERIVECFYELGVQPWTVAKFSSIGCSSKSPAYFLGLSHGFNGVHGRMPAIATGALLANHTVLGIGVTGDGDTASIGIGQFMHLVRRNIPMIYIIENNGVYGLTKGQ